MEKICAVVVTFNRLDLLKICLNALKKQTRILDEILIIDNHSTDGTTEFLKETYSEDQKVEILYLKDNLGGAGGFETGIRHAYQENFDWLWVMDDDAEPESTCLEALLKYNSRSIGLLAPVIINKKSKKVQNYHHKRLNDSLTKDIYISNDEIRSHSIIELDANAFVGPLISHSAIERIGFPRGDFFIWLDDTEYTYRISRRMPIRLVTHALIYHNDKAGNNNKVLNFWKHCYGSRNRWLWRHTTLHGVKLVRGNVAAYVDYIKQFIKILVKNDWKGNRKTGLKFLVRTIIFSQNRIPGKFIDPADYLSMIRNTLFE
ncbi:glycosyltransferase family 2 protein [Sporolactobacillus sp. Y61]|uniref:Glycosyltransferase family 2 protein n=1 Tax=Sporolactobacillus sp. Y61 TaxID=3160863 RepID=A0AAU8IHU6_9BACL